MSSAAAMLLDHAPEEAARLSATERASFLHHGLELLRSVSWEGARGFDLTTAMTATIAAHAALMAAGFAEWDDPFRDVRSVVVHPRTIVDRALRPGPTAGVVTADPRHLAGSAGPGRGPILLDWATIQRDIPHPERGTNVIFHEFAHKFDQLDGVMDGVPLLPDKAARAEWEQTIGTNFRRLRRRGRDPLVRDYAATNEVEYFAVTSELFFTRPVELQAHLPRVYQRLADCYRQDPASRSRGHERDLLR